MGCIILLWHSLSLPYDYFVVTTSSYYSLNQKLCMERFKFGLFLPNFGAGAQFEGDLGKYLPYIGLREKWESS